MSAVTTITITRSDTTELFYYDTSSYESIDLQNFLQQHGSHLLLASSSYSDDELTFTMYLIYPTLEDEQAFKQAWIEAFPTFVDDRQNYCNEKNHVLTVETEVSEDE
jgi:hypothetical protein